MGKTALRGACLVAIAALAGCGGSSSGNGDLAALAAAASAPCATAFTASGSSVLAGVRQLAGTGAGTSSDPVDLSSCTEFFDSNRNITIGPGGCGPFVKIDKSFTGAAALGKITIASGGGLAVPATFDQLELDTTGISVAGTMSIGTEQCPVGRNNPASHIQIVFTGKPVATSGPSDIGSGSDNGIEVQSGGSLRLYGTRGVAPNGVNWTYLSKPAGPVAYQQAGKNILAPVEGGGEYQIHLAANVHSGPGAWRTGDWIVVATTSFSPFESEFVQISSIDAEGSGTRIGLKQPLTHYHFGGADPGPPSDANYGVGPEVNYGVDERAEVGLVSRNITLSSSTPFNPQTAGDQSNHWGGEIRILPGFLEARIQGVELEKFGKARLGSYPIHFHMTGDVSGRFLVDSNSIHHSYNKCVTVHMTQNLSVTNNVCARAVGHLFYEEMAQEQGTSFVGNLGIGAMSNSFGLDPQPSSAAAVTPAYWQGDYLARADNYNGLGVPNMDNQQNPVHGSCYTVNALGGLVFARNPVTDGKYTPCEATQVYVEQATGFWIGNPGTILQGNSVAGCQGQGKGYWYVAPTVGKQQFEPIGSFLDNRVHGCFDGLFGESDEGVISQQLFPRVGGSETGLSLVAHFKGLTATRIRNRGVWMRPAWNSVESGRFATTRDAVSLVSSGGLDGNAPGVWAMLKDSVLVGLSNNNVDRWGPCPTQVPEGLGCVDRNKNASDFQFKGYQMPFWNSAGYMIYDGPVRIVHNHFVNYLRDPTPLLTTDDSNFLKGFVAYPKGSTKIYEGDAALGWFQSNFSAYPTATTTRELSFHNVDLRHQIYTDQVNLADFVDGDKNTAIIDLDGSLSGYQVVDANQVPVPGEYPISLNNLEFNHTGNAADECQSTGQQDAQYEGRPTSIMSAANTATLEFEALSPGIRDQWWQNLTFTKDSEDAGVHQSMLLLGRNGKGIWEPKVASGTGYTVAASVTTRPGQAPLQPGMPSTLHVGFTDAVKSNMSAKNPFYVRVGICYSNAQGQPPNGNFTITRGYRSWGGNGTNAALPAYRPFYTQLLSSATPASTRNCDNLDNNNFVGGEFLNLDPAKGCPAQGLSGISTGAACPTGSTPSADGKLCVFPTNQLNAAATLAEMSNPDGTPVDDPSNPGNPAFDKYYFDKTTGMLFFYVKQSAPNAHGIAPLGSCSNPPQPGDDPACPDAKDLDTYYGCPAQGCSSYSVVLNDPGYTPGPSACAALAGGDLYAPATGFSLTQPSNLNQLGYVGAGGPTGAVTTTLTTSPTSYKHWAPTQTPACNDTPPKVFQARTAQAAAPRTVTASLFAPERWLHSDLATKLAMLARDPLAGMHIRRPAALDPLMLSQICSAAGG